MFEEQGVKFVKKPDDGKMCWMDKSWHSLLFVFNYFYKPHIYIKNYDITKVRTQAKLKKCFPFVHFFLSSIPYTLYFLSQVKWKAWLSFRTLTATGLRSWALTTWCPLPHKTWQHATCSPHTPTCSGFTQRAEHWSVEKNLAICWQAEWKWSRITCTMPISVPWHGLDSWWANRFELLISCY